MAGLTGVVKFFNDEKGYGFIGQDGGQKDIFVHARDLQKSKIEGPIDKGDELSFEIEDGPRGPRAVNISRL